MTYLWIEDRKGKSGYVFWETFMKQLYPSIIVESKKNNSELVKAVKRLNNTDNVSGRTGRLMIYADWTMLV
ncbi:MAG: hypothetical protein NC416_05175 [Eubacterium sp.]|nr:hypothetical protein [Eubacterium sp.]